MEQRHQAWKKIRNSLPGPFYSTVKASKLEKELRLSKGGLQGKFAFTPFTLVEKAAAEVAQLDEALVQERITTLQKHQEYSTRWTLAAQRGADLDQVIQAFSLFNSLNDGQIQEDLARRAEYLQETREEEAKLAKLRKERDALIRVKGSLQARQEHCGQYKDFLVSVLETYNQNEDKDENDEEDESLDKPRAYPMREIQDLITRYEELKQTRAQITAQVLQNVDQSVKIMEEERKEKVHLHHESESYRGYAQKLIDYKAEKLEVHVGGLNEKLITVKKAHHAHILRAEQLKINVFNVYCNLAKEMGQQIKLKEGDVQGQLGFISKFLAEMKKLRYRVKQSLKAGSNVALTSGMKEIERTSNRSSL